MPKMRISKSVRDRFKISKSGKIIRRKIGQRHLKSNKSRTNLRRGKEPIEVKGAMRQKLRKLLGF